MSATDIVDQFGDRHRTQRADFVFLVVERSQRIGDCEWTAEPDNGAHYTLHVVKSRTTRSCVSFGIPAAMAEMYIGIGERVRDKQAWIIYLTRTMDRVTAEPLQYHPQGQPQADRGSGGYGYQNVKDTWQELAKRAEKSEETSFEKIQKYVDRMPEHFTTAEIEELRRKKML